jgi:glycosyltransferase involved in cell wall biosynthesis
MLDFAQKDSDILVTGEVNDVRDYLKRLKVFVAPIRLGKGFRGKLLEAMAMGIPVVTTRLGAEGIPVREGENILLAETPEEFIQKTLTLLSDGQLHSRISTNSRKLVVDRFSWQKGVELLEEKLQRLVETD